MGSFKKKIETIIEKGVDPIKEGIANFNNPNKEIEELAKDRAAICAGCHMMETEPVFFLKVKDKVLTEISEKMCGECGCTLPYKVRQNQTTCPKWNK